MSVAPDQLGEISRQLREFFNSHPVITVAPLKGDSTDQYSITYNMAGMSKSSDGEVIESGSHTIELAIPFGFPHFPPSCKPATNIYHPDFDPGAICLGDFWEKTPDLPELIIYIGQLINGESYSVSNAFNEDAAVWYQDNHGNFPLTAISWTASSSPDTKKEALKPEIDTLDDEDFSDEFDYLALNDEDEDEKITLDDSFPEIGVEPDTEVDFDLINLLNKQKRFCKLQEVLKGHSSLSGELQSLSQIADEAVTRGESLYRLANVFEKEGNAEQALLKYENVESVVSDFPSITTDIKRINQTLSLLDSVSSTSSLEDEFMTPLLEADSPELVPKQVEPAKTKPKKQRRKIKKDPFASERKASSKAPLIATLALFLLAAGATGIFYYLASGKLRNGENAYQQCVTAMQNSQFANAESYCKSANQFLSSIQFVHQNRVDYLKVEINKILRSDELVQGLSGKILFDGQYISKKDATIIQNLNSLLQDAESHYSDKKWLQAHDKFISLLKKDPAGRYLGPEQVEEVTNKINMAQFQVAFEAVQKEIASKKWEKTKEKIEVAKKLLLKLPSAERGEYQEKLQLRLDQCLFEISNKQGEQAFSEGNWNEAISVYKQALEADKNEFNIPQAQRDQINNNIDKAELYLTIDKGNKAFGAGDWSGAIEAYRNADTVLQRNQSLLDYSSSALNQKKIARIILQASIVRDQQAVKSHLHEEELREARKTYIQILGTINNSKFLSDSEFVETRNEINKALMSLDDKIYQSDKKQYLQDNYKSLFVANYPAAVPEKLVKPVIVFVKETSSKMIYRMQCTEKKRGRPLNLVMFYAYDKNRNTWSLHTEN